jgi:Undecaprenyl-phosphate glucose phosphotransferase
MSLAEQDITVTANPENSSLPRLLYPGKTWPIRYDSIELLTMLFDFAVIIAASLLSSLVYNFEVFGIRGDFSKSLGAAIVASALFLSLMKNHGMYKPEALLSLRNQIQGITIIWACVFFLLAATAFALKISSNFSRGAIISFFGCGLAILVGQRVLWRDIFKTGLAQKRFAGRNVVLIVDRLQTGTRSLCQTLENHGFRLARLYILPAPQHGARRRQEIVDEAISYIQESDIDEVIVGADPNHWSGVANLAVALRVLPLPVNFMPLGRTADVFRGPSRELGSSICIELQRGPLTTLECIAKRSVDIVIASMALVALTPLFLFVALAIKLDSPGPVLFRQRRCGFSGRCFQILKFRTMTVLEDGSSIAQAQQCDARFTRLGRWLRRTSIDELPQLINVLRGNMSLIGPRPHAVAHDVQFVKQVQNYALRHRVKPGLTGWAQVHGYRGETMTPNAIERRVEHDLWYIDHWTLTLDLKIMLLTVVEILRARNAY